MRILVKCYAEIFFYNGDKSAVFHYYIPDGVELMSNKLGECEFYSDMINDMREDVTLNIVFYHPAMEMYLNIDFMQSEEENKAIVCVDSFTKDVCYTFCIDENNVYELFDYIVSNYSGIRVK